MCSALFFSGKHDQAGVAATYALPSTSSRLFVRDRKTNICFLVDTGSDCSILPANKTQKQSPAVQNFIEANGKPIQVSAVSKYSVLIRMFSEEQNFSRNSNFYDKR
ncbi:hypothetical protein AVEN_228175-1 [Araneus ventricosus]|uniref:Peptidase A2 domain-containing protein n=1 Tax=Araneus ventricosus TaxID=182803 RepID=A0A4Y2CUT1_ARAVE|nr:hypothetical protein AVEN_228175-1 [Araneus ventricosus]